MRTFSRSDWEAAQASWEGFSPEWRELRHLMAMQGVVFAPAGTEWDSWEDDSPSQRAMLIRAIREQPTLLMGCARGAKSWADLIGRLLDKRDDWREEVAEREAEAFRQRMAELPASRTAPQSLASILRRVADSAGIDR